MHVCVLGAGSLSLGLICPWLAGLPHVELSLLTRAGPSVDSLMTEGGYRVGAGVDGEGTRYELGTLFPRGVLSYDPEDLNGQDAATCLAHLSEVDVAVVSVGVPNLHSVASILASGLHSVRRHAETYWSH